MSEALRKAAEQAIDTIGYYASVCGEDDQDTPAKQTQAALRAALAEHEQSEPVITDAMVLAALRDALAEPVAEPVLQIAKALRVHGMSLIKTTDGYDIMRLDDIKAQSKSPQPSPAKVPLLTDDEIAAALPWAGFDDIIESYSAQQLHAGLRAIEALVRKNAGLKCL